MVHNEAYKLEPREGYPFNQELITRVVGQ